MLAFRQDVNFNCLDQTIQSPFRDFAQCMKLTQPHRKSGSDAFPFYYRELLDYLGANLGKHHHLLAVK